MFHRISGETNPDDEIMRAKRILFRAAKGQLGAVNDLHVHATQDMVLDMTAGKVQLSR